MPDRKFSDGDSYRYGFNGKEDDRGWGTQNVQDYGFRLYNPSIAKFLSVDPLSPNYPMLTPYQFAHNRPIVAIDLDGLEAKDTNDDVTESTQTQEDQSEKKDSAYDWSPSTTDEKISISDDLESGDYAVNSAPENSSQPLRHERGTPNSLGDAPYEYFLGDTDVGYVPSPTGLVATAAYNSNDNFFAKRLLLHYTTGIGGIYEMNSFETSTLLTFTKDFWGTNDSRVDFSSSRKSNFSNFKTRFGDMAIGEVNQNFTFTVRGFAALDGGTLGQFSIIYAGTLIKRANNFYDFVGTGRYTDTYDFDSHLFDFNSKRSWSGEFKTTTADLNISGKKFKILSAPFQANTQIRL